MKIKDHIQKDLQTWIPRYLIFRCLKNAEVSGIQVLYVPHW